jgi:hypothetical protein
MRLIKNHEVTEKQLAANRRNQKLCNAPVTDERRDRIRAALLCFGFNAEAEEIAMRGLGEDPAHFQKLLERLWEEWNPVGSVQEGLVIRPARVMWLRIKRYERQTQALEKADPLHYVPETNGVSSLAPECPEPLSQSNENS